MGDRVSCAQAFPTNIATTTPGPPSPFFLLLERVWWNGGGASCGSLVWSSKAKSKGGKGGRWSWLSNICCANPLLFAVSGCTFVRPHKRNPQMIVRIPPETFFAS